MMKIPFDIKYRPEIESGKYKVVTRDDREVAIKEWQMKGNYPILATMLVDCSDFYGENSWQEERPFAFNKEGKASVACSIDKKDLFILTDGSELTEFEKELIKIMKEEGSPIGADTSKYTEGDIEAMHSYSERLLKLARKQLQPEIDAEINLAYKNSDEVQYRSGREDALKDLPKWVPDQDSPQYQTWDMLENGILYHHGHHISLDDLWNKLPKDE